MTNRRRANAVEALRKMGITEPAATPSSAISPRDSWFNSEK
jgi:hypothetical protein